MNFKSIALLFSLLSVPLHFCMVPPKIVEVILSVNHLSPCKNKVDMAVSIPSNFVVVVDQAFPDFRHLHFESKIDSNTKNASELIALVTSIGGKYSAIDEHKKLGDTMARLALGTVLEESTKIADCHEESKLVIAAYDKFANSRKLFFEYRASGPVDSSSVCYTIHLIPEMCLVKALAKAKEFMDKNVRIILSDSDSSEAVD